MNALIIMMAVMAASVVALFTWSGPAWSDDKGKDRHHTRDMVEMSKTAKVGIEQAIKTASEKVAGKVIEAELERKHDRAVWEVEIASPDGKVSEVHVDADSGAVIDVEEKGAGKKKSK
jgi:uncharacterized membrane protein YkoI